MPNKKINGTKLKAEITNHGLQIRELARELEMKESFLYDMIGGRSNNFERLEKIADRLGIPAHIFLKQDIKTPVQTEKPYNGTLYRESITALEAALDEANVTVTKDIVKRIVDHIYDHALNTGHVSIEYVKGAVNSALHFGIIRH